MMFKIISFTVIAFIQMESILSENPTCVVYDFNDPLILNEFENCYYYPGYPDYEDEPFILKSYNESSFEPFRPTSQQFLTNDANTLLNCISTKIEFRINYKSLALKMHYNIVGDRNAFQNVQFLVAGTLTPSINRASNGWSLYEQNLKYLSIEGFPDIVDGVIKLRATLANHSTIAIEYFKFYDPQLTDEDCVPLQTDAPVTTSTPETETFSTGVETVTPETETPSTGNPSCLKLDFSKPSSVSNALRECGDSYLPGLITKTYVNETIRPFNDIAIYYLSNKWEGLSCLESTSIVSINETSVFESAIYLNGLWPGAWITVHVIDVYTREQHTLISLESENGSEWKLLTGQVDRTFDNAQIVINTNMNSYSQLAVEYFNVC